MKKKIITIIIALSSMCSCTNTDHKAVTDYLAEKGIVNLKEIKWGVKDSIYSPLFGEIPLENMSAHIDEVINELDFKKKYYVDSEGLQDSIIKLCIKQREITLLLMRKNSEAK